MSKYNKVNEIDVLKKMKEEIKKELIEELKAKEEVYVNQQVFTSEIRQKYHKRIYEKFGTTKPIEDAIRYVAIYSMGYRRLASIPLPKQDEFNEKLEKIYKFVLEGGTF